MGVRTVVLALMLLVAPAAMARETPTQVRLVSEEWLDYTNADGSGVA